jgi:DNA mismatch endonuclease (patch repair protein)
LRKYHISGWRRNQAVPGKPDFVFPKHRIALFVDGCFWHGCPLPKHSNLPKNNRGFWTKKLQANKDRDKFVNKKLQKLGWKVVRVWEHELKDPERVARKIQRYIG